MDLEIQAQHVVIQDFWREFVNERAALFAERFPELVRMHVTFRHGAHHRQGTERVHVLANVAGEAISVTKDEDDIPAALHAALDAVERELKERHAERRAHASLDVAVGGRTRA